MIEEFLVTLPDDAPKGWSGINQSLELAASVAILGLRAWREGKAVTPESLLAVYVRASDAEINEQWQRQKAQQPAQA